MTALWLEWIGTRLALERVLGEAPRLMTWTVIGHAALAVLFAAALSLEMHGIDGAHPALKPLKFAISIAIFLATMMGLIPSLGLPPTASRALGAALSLTMIVEMTCIVVQALRGTRSHFNVATPLDAAIWRTMVAAIVIATLLMVLVAILASLRPLVTLEGRPMSPWMSAAWRAGLWIFLLAAVSGFAMGGRLAHSVGGEDGGVGLPLLGWSVTHGDLRAAHFVALHALQVLPIVACILEHATSVGLARTVGLSVAIVTLAALSVGTLAQAFAGRPLIATRATEHTSATDSTRPEGAKT